MKAEEPVEEKKTEAPVEEKKAEAPVEQVKAAPVKTSAAQGLIELIKELWYYHKPTEYIPPDGVFESKTIELAELIRQDLETAIEKNNDRIADIMKNYPNAAEETD